MTLVPRESSRGAGRVRGGGLRKTPALVQDFNGFPGNHWSSLPRHLKLATASGGFGAQVGVTDWA